MGQGRRLGNTSPVRTSPPRTTYNPLAYALPPSREDRKRRRAQLKRHGKADRARMDVERRDKAIAQGGTAPVSGRK